MTPQVATLHKGLQFLGWAEVSSRTDAGLGRTMRILVDAMVAVIPSLLISLAHPLLPSHQVAYTEEEEGSPSSEVLGRGYCCCCLPLIKLGLTP